MNGKCHHHIAVNRRRHQHGLYLLLCSVGTVDKQAVKRFIGSELATVTHSVKFLIQPDGVDSNHSSRIGRHRVEKTDIAVTSRHNRGYANDK